MLIAKANNEIVSERVARSFSSEDMRVHLVGDSA